MFVTPKVCSIQFNLKYKMNLFLNIVIGRHIKFILQIEELRNGYMAKAVAYAKSTEEALVPMQLDVRQLQTEVS